MSGISEVGWVVLGVLGLVVATFLFIIAMRKGFKAGIGDKTIEVSGSDGEKQDVDNQGLMYIMNDNCRQIEQRKKEKIDSIIPDIEYRLDDISAISCLIQRAEKVLQDRRRKNGFEKLTTERLFFDYVNEVACEISNKVRKEIIKVTSCSAQPIGEINEDAIMDVALKFTLRAVFACLDEYREKSTMYTQFEPQFIALHDKNRVIFCKQKIEKHDERIVNLSAMLTKIEEGKCA